MMFHDFEVLLVSEESGLQCNINAYIATNGQSLATFKGGTSHQKTLCTYKDEYILSSLPNKAVVNVYAISRRIQQPVKMVLPGVVNTICISNDDTVLAAGIKEKVFVWELAGGELLSVLTRHYQDVSCLAFSHDDSYIVSSGDDGIITVWDMADVWDIESSDQCNETPEPYHSWTCHTLPVSQLLFGSRFRVYSSSLDQSVKIYDVPTKQTIMTIVLSVGVTTIVLGPNEISLYCGCSDGTIHEVSLLYCDHYQRSGLQASLSGEDQEKNIQVINAHQKKVTSLACSLDGTYIVSGSADCTVKVWDASGHQCLRTIKCNGGITNTVLVLATMRFTSNTKPSFEFPKLSHQKLPFCSDAESIKKQFKIREEDASEDSGNADAVRETLCLQSSSHESPKSAHVLAYEKEKLTSENEKLYRFALENILTKSQGGSL